MKQVFVRPDQCVWCSNHIRVIGGYKHKKAQGTWYSGNLCQTCSGSMKPKIGPANYGAISRTQYLIEKISRVPEIEEIEPEEPEERQPKWYKPMFAKKGWLSKWFDDNELHRLFVTFDEMLEYARKHHYNTDTIVKMKNRKRKEMET